MTLHVLGICGTFMGGLAAIAREAGYAVEGSDRNVYPPMSDQLRALGIALKEGFEQAHLQPHPELVLIGNALSRGNPAVEYVLDQRLNYASGPEWLGREVLAKRTVLAVAGTHGKTTTTAMLAWILECAGRAPGFLIGGVPHDFPVSARLGRGELFVIEADEYDTAFFDKRSKFVHYRPQVAILNNLEYDHADIFPDLAAIQRQFHHLVRIVPSSGALVVPRSDEALAEVLKMGCWSRVVGVGRDAAGDGFGARVEAADGSRFALLRDGQEVALVRLQSSGLHNVDNALAAIAAAAQVGVAPIDAAAALARFRGVKRRLELLGEHSGVRVYDDFAHHPTAIERTLDGLKRRNAGRLIAVLEPRSNSMRAGAHAAQLAPALGAADRVFLLARPELQWDWPRVIDALDGRGEALPTTDALLNAVLAQTRPGDSIVFMSNGGFDNVQRRFVEKLR
jgi:UDP-N-acetylmuramate: L-alanyl-gamma-D-glutamyl-meso-diaminopimelate ligase